MLDIKQKTGGVVGVGGLIAVTAWVAAPDVIVAANAVGRYVGARAIVATSSLTAAAKNPKVGTWVRQLGNQVQRIAGKSAKGSSAAKSSTSQSAAAAEAQKRAEAARDAAGQQLKRKHATNVGGHEDGKEAQASPPTRRR